MEPQVQYARTSDGVSIAYTVLGDGRPLIFMSAMFSDIRLMMQVDEIRAFFMELSRDFRLIYYDGRGCGLSDRDVEDMALLGRSRDLEAVVEREGLSRFSLLAWDGIGPAGIVYAAHNPEKIDRLILYATYARSAYYDNPDRIRSLIEFIKSNWRLGSRTLALATNPKASPDFAEQVGNLYRRSTSLDYATLTIEEMHISVDIREMLPLLTMPTLVLHREHDGVFPLRTSQDMATRLPHATLKVLRGTSHEPMFEDPASVIEAVRDFLLQGKAGESVAEYRELLSSVHTILFTDIEGSTELTRRLGDDRARALFREHERITREVLREYGGTEVKALGDGFMASFGSARRALECAMALQRAMEEWNKNHGPGNMDLGVQGGTPLRVRIGLNAGEPIAEDADLFGTAVILAARIAAQARGGEILVSNVVRELAAGKGFMFSSRGRTALKGFEEPAEVFEVRWWDQP